MAKGTNNYDATHLCMIPSNPLAHFSILQNSVLQRKLFESPTLKSSTKSVTLNDKLGTLKLEMHEDKI